jgi:hypothetical protein
MTSACFPGASPKDISMKLDAKSIAALKLGGRRDFIHFDGALPGFGYRLRQGAGGKLLRSWVVQYRRAGGTRQVLLGSADVVSGEAARQAAKKILAKAAIRRAIAPTGGARIESRCAPWSKSTSPPNRCGPKVGARSPGI